MFGVGGGFLLTPLLIFIGISPAVAVASVSPQIAAALFSGFLAHWRRGTIDVLLGMMLLVGGITGALVGVWLFTLLRDVGQLDSVRRQIATELLRLCERREGPIGDIAV